MELNRKSCKSFNNNIVKSASRSTTCQRIYGSAQCQLFKTDLSLPRHIRYGKFKPKRRMKRQNSQYTNLYLKNVMLSDQKVEFC